MATATRPSRDQVVIQLATEQGVTDQGMIAKRLVEMGYDKITDTRVGQILRANSGRDQIVRFLEEHPDDTFSSVEISTWTKIDINKVNYVIDALSKKGVVTYKVGRADSDHRTLVNIVLTKRTRAAIAARVKAATKTAKGVDTVKLAELETPVIEPAIDAPADIPADIPELQAELPAPAPDVTTEPEIAIESISIQDYIKYPLIGKLLDREHDLSEAAKLLDRHGFDDLELAVLAKMDEYSPLEREILAYVQAHAKACRQP